MKKSWRVAAERMPADASFPFLPSARYDEPAFGLVTYAFVAPGYAFRRRASLRYSREVRWKADNGATTYLLSCGEEGGMIYFHLPRGCEREMG